MIQIVLFDDRDFINEHRQFKNDATGDINEYILKGVLDKNTREIKMRKFPDDKQRKM